MAASEGEKSGGGEQVSPAGEAMMGRFGSGSCGAEIGEKGMQGVENRGSEGRV